MRGWLLDVLNCVNSIADEIFPINDVYIFTEHLARKHPDNHNVLAKIRQQMQYLRDKGFIENFSAEEYTAKRETDKGCSCIVIEAKRELSEDLIKVK